MHPRMDDVRRIIEQLLAEHPGQFRELDSSSDVDLLDLKEAVVRIFDEDDYFINEVKRLLGIGQAVLIVAAGTGKWLLLASPGLFGQRRPESLI